MRSAFTIVRVSFIYYFVLGHFVSFRFAQDTVSPEKNCQILIYSLNGDIMHQIRNSLPCWIQNSAKEMSAQGVREDVERTRFLGLRLGLNIDHHSRKHISESVEERKRFYTARLSSVRLSITKAMPDIAKTIEVSRKTHLSGTGHIASLHRFDSVSYASRKPVYDLAFATAQKC